MSRILFVAPTQGNGGIASWASNYRRNMSNYNLISVGVSKRRSQNVTAGIVKRIFSGFFDMFDVISDVRKRLVENPDVRIMHLTVSGGMGTIRDYVLARIAKSRNVKMIMHCHYGSIVKDLSGGGQFGSLIRKTMLLFDQIWVLDSQSLNFLNSDKGLENKVFMLPNFIDVNCNYTKAPKSYRNVAFVGNLFPTKGIFELVEAVKSLSGDTVLHIVGPGLPKVVEHIKEIAGECLGKNIRMYGQMPNEQAIKFMEGMDIIALPTYYHQEAFPISILEAMSHGKMVISCDRGAIRDMLTGVDGRPCGIIVKPKDSKSIADSIRWCQEHSEDADLMCEKAYEKVSLRYETRAVMKQYESCYKLLEE